MPFPERICLDEPLPAVELEMFLKQWQGLMMAECHEHSIWKSEFVEFARDQKLNPSLRFELAAVWALNMVHGSYCFPRYVAALASRAESDALRHGLLENAWDESGGVHHRSRSHYWLAVRLAYLLGLSERTITEISPLPRAAEYTDEHFQICSEGGVAQALGMICLIEEFTTPEFTLIFETFLSTCEVGLGLTSGRFVLGGGAEYFTANIADDERHREEMPLLVARLMSDKEGKVCADVLQDGVMAGVLSGIRKSIGLRQRFFENIHSFVTSGGSYRDLVR
jgi:pyrroloquinoline quinone (PQQ) biosynthesis protein C